MSITWSYPGLFAVGGDTVFPTYLARLFGATPSPVFPLQFDMACATLSSTTGSPQSVDLSLAFPSFGATATQTVMVPATGTVRQCIDPLFTWDALSGVRTTTPSGIQLTAAATGTGTPFASTMHSVSVLASNAVVWTVQPPATTLDMRALSAVFIQPNNPDVLSLRSDAERLSQFGTFGTAPFHQTMSRAWAVAGGAYTWDVFFMEAGETLNVQVTNVAGGSGTVELDLFTDAQFATWRAGTGMTAEYVVMGASTGATHTYTAPADGWYAFVVNNVGDTSNARNVSFGRTATYYDVAFDVAQATFLAVRNRGVSYSNIASADLSGLQYIRTPSDVLAMGAGNCLEGTLLFASVFENVGFDAWLLYYACPDLGHAIVGVRAPGARLYWPIETTMVGGTATPFQALNSALTTGSTHSACRTALNVQTLRAQHIDPGM